MSATAFHASLQLLRTRRFGTFWFASLLSNIGTWAQQLAQPWLLLSMGASPFLLGVDAFALAAPVFLLTLVGGLFTGLSISLLGVRYALLFNGLLALLCQMVVAIYWARNHTDA